MNQLLKSAPDPGESGAVLKGETVPSAGGIWGVVCAQLKAGGAERSKL